MADHKRRTPVLDQIEADIAERGREAEILRTLAPHIETAVVAAMSVAEKDTRVWIRSEVESWQLILPMSEDECAWLRTYVRSLVIDEMGRRGLHDDED
ncbi:hypothetical protein ACQKKX_04415 [Neorhizobium sp. NPDC001467]|uniref:hypothetical protein n=1 Tax=Neorhizobium sp. NPDC001467 TaxID=3390595 RepID=UPI003D079AB5